MHTTRISILLATCLGITLLFPATASAHEYLPTSPGQSWTYVSDYGAVVESQITSWSGSWFRFSRFANLRDQWVWTNEKDAAIWLLRADGARRLPRFARGWTASVDLGCSPATVRFDAKDLLLDVPAGSFSGVVKLSVDAPCIDAGATTIWFARGVGIIQWSENTLFGNVTFRMVRGPSVGQLVRLPAAVRDTYDQISQHLDAEVRTAIDGLPQTVLLGQTAFVMMSPPEMSVALPYAIRDALDAHGLDSFSFSDADVDQLALVVAVDLVDLVDVLAEQELGTPDLAMINLQSAMAARAESLEIIDNMMEAFARSTDSIIGRIQ